MSGPHGQPGPVTAEDLERQCPWIAWREPVQIGGYGGLSGLTRWACRLCIGLYGLKGTDVPALPTTREEVTAHIAQAHGTPSGPPLGTPQQHGVQHQAGEAQQ